ncbi:MAG: type II toxin-antitoxin system RelE/ParE family toxin [Candidatus Nitricoxidivorans perseverans]|uniref:Type II toxin-antitoxin system RelE/ParE family toxin n=1 Tax=Candidatus Nitricoxidivorans perseverans TaxID=2975601 RepID=A0AA49FLI2_9PROT|nr:MAG: type II toxin-antitoxin system RelE/ParE family toxin [Candidatus Nitricoxidivorans perseverans]
MRYSLEFRDSAWKEWQKLDRGMREQFKARLAERLENPHVESARLAGMPDCYKIKLRAAGYRLVYQVFDARVVVVVVAIGKREDSAVYRKAQGRLKRGEGR